jgi:ribose 5-phosphate isomerase B
MLVDWLERGDKLRIAIGTDHAGFSLRKPVLQAIVDSGHEVIDFGAYNEDRVDFPDFARKVAEAVQKGEADRGIAMCGSGVGVCIASNKFNGVYASVCHDVYSAHQGVEHDGMNVLCLGGKVIGTELAREIVLAFLRATQNPDPRYLARIRKVKVIEEESRKGKR